MMRDESQRIIVGRISGIYGVQGWLKLISYTRPRDNIFNYNPWLLNLDDNWQEMVMLDGKRQAKGLISRLDGIQNRDEAKILLNADIAIYRHQLGVTEPGENYWHDLIGMNVINCQNETLGQLTEILETGANDVLVVEGERRVLIPFIRNIYVMEIDLEKSIIKVDWHSGDD